MGGMWTVKNPRRTASIISHIYTKIIFVRLFERLRCFLVAAGLDLNQRPPGYEGLNFLKTLQKSYKTNVFIAFPEEKYMN